MMKNLSRPVLKNKLISHKLNKKKNHLKHLPTNNPKWAPLHPFNQKPITINPISNLTKAPNWKPFQSSAAKIPKRKWKNLVNSSMIDSNNLMILMPNTKALSSLKIDTYMKAIGKIRKEMGKGNNSGKMVLSMKDIGKIILPMAMEDSSTEMEMSTQDNGKTIELVGKGSISQIVAHNMRVFGKTTNKKGKVNRNGKMELPTKVVIKKGKKMAKESFFGETIVVMKENFFKTKSMGKVNMYGKMGVSMRGTG